MKNISIIATSYKSEKYLETFFQSVLALNNLDMVEVNLICNVPNNIEAEVLNKYSKKYYQLFNIIILDKLETIAQSFNRGFRISANEYISYMDVDDFRLPDSFTAQFECLEENRKIDYTYGDFIVVKNQGENTGKKIIVPEFDRILFTRGCYVSPTHFYRKSLFNKIGYWDEQFKSGGDFEFQVRAAAAGVKFKKTNATLLYYTKEENSKSASSTILQPIERTVIELRYGIFDKIDYRYYDKAMEYRIHEIKEGDNWIPIGNVIPNYEKFIEERKYLLPIGKRNHFIKMLKKNIKLPFKIIFKPKKYYYDYFTRKK
jgi:GT2 family glycosyltransferase